MTSQAYHHNKKTGATYVYSVKSYWDKQKNAPRNKQVCVGKLDKSTGEVIPSLRKTKPARESALVGVTADARVVGPAMLLDKLAIDTGLAEILRRCFPDCHSEIMSLVPCKT